MSLQVPGPALLSDSTVAGPAGTFPVGTSGITATQVAYGSGVNTIKGSSSFKYIEGTGHLLLGNISDGTNGVLQFPAGASDVTSGLAFNDDTYFYRTAQGQLTLRSSGVLSSLHFNENGTDKGEIFTSSGVMTIRTVTSQNLILATASTAAITINTTQGVSLANNLTLAGTALITKPGGTIPLITTNTAITDQAGAALGTLSNAPTAGNPTKWILINDNGTTRKIPTWT